MKKDFSTWCGSLAAAFACAWSMVAAAWGGEPFLTAWGMDANGQASPTAEAVVCGGASAIAAGYYHSLAVVDSRVYAWGAEEYDRCTVPPAGRTNVVDVAAGREFSVALRNDGTLVSWGQFADDHSTSNKLTGDYTNDVAQVAAGERHALVLKNGGRVMATGDSSIKSEWEVPVAAQSDVVQVAAGAHFSLALKSDHTIVAWGNADERESGGVLNVPEALQGHATKISAGHYHALAITDTGELKEWGWIVGHKIPDAALTNTVVDIAAGYDFSMALTSGGQVYLWGNDLDGRALSDMPASLDAPVSRIAAGWGHCLALGAGMVPHWLDNSVPTNAFVARAYSGYVSATGMPGVVYFHDAAGWPQWLTLDGETGELSGMPLATSRVARVTIYATNAYGSISSNFEVSVLSTPLEPPVFVTTDVPDGEVGVPYDFAIVASNATSYYLSRTGQVSLPAGLSLAPDGTLSGIPLSEDNTAFYVVASNATDQVEKQFRIIIGPAGAAPIIITDSPLDDALVGTPKSWEITTDRQAEFSLADVPAGLGIGIESVSATHCTLAATPTAAGDYSFTVKAANSIGTTTSNFSLAVNAVPAITTEALPPASVGTSYQQTIAATGWPVPVLALATGSSLPDGLAFANGTISGKPTKAGSFDFSVTASNKVGTVARGYTLVVDSVQRPQFTSMTFSNKTVRLEWTTAKTNGTYLYWSRNLAGTNWTSLGKKTSPWTGPQTNSTPIYYQLRSR